MNSRWMRQVGCQGGGSRSGWCTVAAAVGLLLASGSGLAAGVDAAEMARLTRHAAEQGAVRVMVNFEVGASLDAMAKGRESLRGVADQKAEALLAELGAEAWEAGRWRNGLGQIGFYVTPTGLQRLAASTVAASFAADPTSGLRGRIREGDGSDTAIETALARDGEVEVEIALETDGAEHEVDRTGRARFRASREAGAEWQARVDRIARKPWGRGIRRIDASAMAESGSFRATIDRQAYAALRESDDVRAVRPIGFVDQRPSRWSTAALDEARATGTAEVVVTLRGSHSFSPKAGFMSASSWKAQANSHSKVLAEVFAGEATEQLGKLSDNQLALGSVTLRLSAGAMERLYAARDPRVLDVSANVPVAKPLLDNSMRLINMRSAWNAGYRAAGQSIVVLDTGIRRDHAMFRNPDGSSRVTYEACFGTNSGRFRSFCPQADVTGDSPPGLSGSGEPLSNAWICSQQGSDCSHGTGVASVAAGRSTPSVVNGTLQGAAPDASLISAQIYSFDPSTGDSTIFAADILAALQAVFNATKPGLDNPYVVNMSFGGLASKTSCPNDWTGSANAVQNLMSRGVPVIAGTGNNGYNDMITAPACVPNTIKVSAVANDATGTTRAPYANIADPELFGGPFLFAPAGMGANNGVWAAGVASPTAIEYAAGTSLAAPQVAGAYAAIKAAVPGISVADATAWLMGTGSVDIVVPRPAPLSTRTFRRLRMPNF